MPFEGLPSKNMVRRVKRFTKQLEGLYKSFPISMESPTEDELLKLIGNVYAEDDIGKHPRGMPCELPPPLNAPSQHLLRARGEEGQRKSQHLNPDR